MEASVDLTAIKYNQDLSMIMSFQSYLTCQVWSPGIEEQLLQTDTSKNFIYIYMYMAITKRNIYVN